MVMEKCPRTAVAREINDPSFTDGTLKTKDLPKRREVVISRATTRRWKLDSQDYRLKVR